MKIDQIFFCKTLQSDIFNLCRDYARVTKNKEIKFFSFARPEEVLQKISYEKNKNSIVVSGFYFKNSTLLLPEFAKKIKEINNKNIVIGFTKSETECVYCDAIFRPSDVIVKIGQEKSKILTDAGFEPSILPIVMFFSKNILAMSRRRMVEELSRPIDRYKISSWVLKYKKRA